MRVRPIILILILAASALAACGGEAATTASQETSADSTGSQDSSTYTSAALGTAYEGALPASSQLALGTLKLEGTENAVTPAQAKSLLPLWQALQSGSLQSDTETNAVLKQIEKTMTPEQLAAIAAMQLTAADMGTVASGQSFGPPPGATGGQNPFGNLSEEERAAMRATVEAGGGMPGQASGGMPGGGGAFGNLSEEERAAMRATAEASGMTLPGGPVGVSSGQLTFLAQPVIELLTRRSAE
jgi:hypothetical protein